MLLLIEKLVSYYKICYFSNSPNTSKHKVVVLCDKWILVYEFHCKILGTSVSKGQALGIHGIHNGWAVFFGMVIYFFVLIIVIAS